MDHECDERRDRQTDKVDLVTLFLARVQLCYSALLLKAVLSVCVCPAVRHTRDPQFHVWVQDIEVNLYDMTQRCF